MKINVIGAAGGEVTGSAYMVDTGQARVLVDCGLFQGGKKSEALNRPPLGLTARWTPFFLHMATSIIPGDSRCLLSLAGADPCWRRRQPSP